MTDGVYIVRRGKCYRVTANCKCTARSCSLYDAETCESNCDDTPFIATFTCSGVETAETKQTKTKEQTDDQDQDHKDPAL